MLVGTDGQAGPPGTGGVVDAGLGLHVYQVVEVAELVERVGGGDVVDEEEGVGAEVGGGPHAAVFLLARRVGQGEVVGGAVDAARDAVAVFDGGVVLGGPLRAHEAQGDGGLAAAAVAADGDGDGDGRLRGCRWRWHFGFWA